MHFQAFLNMWPSGDNAYPLALNGKATPNRMGKFAEATWIGSHGSIFHIPALVLLLSAYTQVISIYIVKFAAYQMFRP